jgi:hypothetical protein
MNDMRIINENNAATPNADPELIFSSGGGEDGNDPADNDDILVKVGAVALGAENTTGVEAFDNVRVYADGNDVIVSPTGFGNGPSSVGVDAFFADHLKYIFENGAGSAQVPRIELQDQLGWATNFQGRGIAYAAFFSFYNTEVWMQGIPQYTIRVTGGQVYDPRSSTFINWAASGPSADNPALCILDYLTSKRYGGAVPYAARDGGSEDYIDEQSFIDAANYCDDLVAIPGPSTEKRFRINAVIDTGQVVGANLAEMLSCCRGSLIWQNGIYRIVITQVTVPETFELTEDNIVGPIEWTRKGTAIPNYIECAFVDSLDENFNANTVTWPLIGDTTLLDEDNGQMNRAEMSLPYTTTFLQAQRTIMVLLREARNDVLVNLVCTQAAYELQVGNVVKVTHQGPGWFEEEFTVKQMALTPDGLVSVALQQYNDGAYNLDSLLAQPSTPTTNLPNPTVIDPPTGFVLTADATTTMFTQDGNAVPRILVEWTPPVDPYLSHYEVQFKETALSNFEATANPQRFDDQIFIWPVSEAVEYDVQMRSVNSLGVKSAFVGASVTIFTNGVPDATLSASLDVSQSAVVSASGNGGVASYKIAFASGIAPLVEPTDVAVRARAAVNGQNLTIPDIIAAYGDIPVLLSAGQGCLFKAFAYSLAGGLGNESASFTSFVTRFVDLVYLHLDTVPAPDEYTIVADVNDWNASFVFDLSEGLIKIQDSQQAGAALALTGVAMDEIIILAAPEVP